MLVIAFLDWSGVCVSVYATCVFHTGTDGQGWVYLTSVYYQRLLGQTPLMAAIHVLPGPVTGVLCSVSYFPVHSDMDTSPDLRCLVIFLAPRVSAPLLLVLGSILSG